MTDEEESALAEMTRQRDELARVAKVASLAAAPDNHSYSSGDWEKVDRWVREAYAALSADTWAAIEAVKP